MKKRNAAERKAVDLSSESDLSDAEFGRRPPISRMKGWSHRRDSCKYTVRYWWGGRIKQRIDNRDMRENDQGLVFNFEPNYLYDEDNNVIGLSAPKENQPREQMGNLIQETAEMRELAKKRMRV